jgi:hypothetical protein
MPESANPFQLQPPSTQKADVSLSEATSGTQNPFEPMSDAPTHLGHSTQKSNTLPVRLDVNDTQTLDGLAVHLQSPRLRRQYWVQHYQAEFNVLEHVVALHPPLVAFLQSHQCTGLTHYLQQDMERYRGLKQLYSQLYHHEDAGLRPVEQRMKALWKTCLKGFNGLMNSLPQQVLFREDSHHPEQANTTSLNQKEMAAFREWVNYVASKQPRKGLPPRLLQEFYHIRQKLF